MALTDHGKYAPSAALCREFSSMPELAMALYPGEEIHLPFHQAHILNIGGRQSVNELFAEAPEAFYDNILRQADPGEMPPAQPLHSNVPRWVAALSVLSLAYLDIDWLKMTSRAGDIGVVFWDLAHLDFTNMDLILSSLVETVSIAVLSLLYSLILGIIFGMLAARNVFRLPWLSVLTQSFFTFLRAVPTPVWVLLMLVCLGMGPEAGVAGLCVHTTAFFTKSFAQSFESIPEETIEALEVTGASRLSIFMNAVLPAALSQIVAGRYAPRRSNFSECAILGDGGGRRRGLCDLQ